MNGETYIHNKTGFKYMVLNEAINCTNSNDGEEMVVYASVDTDDDTWFVREYNEFMEKFTKKQTPVTEVF